MKPPVLHEVERARRCFALVAAAALLTVLGGCGGGGANRPISSGDLARGRALFQTGASEGCALCHTLAAARATGLSGPNLDTEMREHERKRLTDRQLADEVRSWIDKGLCLNPADSTRCMPGKIFTGSDAEAVAAFVAVCGRTPKHAGCKPTPIGMPAEAVRGLRLFQTRGCIGCHFGDSSVSTGPSLLGIAGSKVALADGTTVTADDGYLAESIAAPDGQIVAGYQPKVMSSIVGQEHLTASQIAALVAYIKTLKPRSG
jgi:mono/diheme cytochrome c family protein